MEDALIQIPKVSDGWDERLIDFAGSFDGYTFTLGTVAEDDPWSLGAGLRSAYAGTGWLPDDADLLRFALFLEQRNDYAAGGLAHPSDDFGPRGYVRSLVESLRTIEAEGVPRGPLNRRITEDQITKIRQQGDFQCMTTAWWGELDGAFGGVAETWGQSLAYLCLTSKPEHLIRDAMAASLEAVIGRASPGVAVAREWTNADRSRCDLAVVALPGPDGLPTPLSLSELKVYGLYEQLEGMKSHHAEAMRQDIWKLRRQLIADRAAGRQQLVAHFILCHMTFRDQVPAELVPAVKYATKSNKSSVWERDDLEQARSQCNDAALEWLQGEGCAIPGYGWRTTDAGEWRGIGVNLDFLICHV
jgi:hypothetical protein